MPACRRIAPLKGWHGAMAKLAEAPNICVKISGLGRPGVPWTVDGNRWIVEEIVAMFGAGRAMFASNFPVDGLCSTFDTIWTGFKRIGTRYSVEDQRLLFWETAHTVYRTGV
jgi:predicted TIM-barrel fold metal-dependent hydrolase